MKNQPARATGFTLIEIMIVVAIIGLLAAIAIPNYMRSRFVVQRNICINNLRQTDAAIQLWAMENNADIETLVSTLDITPYRGRGITGSLLDVYCPVDPLRTFATSYNIVNPATRPTCRILSATHFIN